MTLTLKEFEILKEILDKIGVHYDDGKYYTNDNTEKICGSWIAISSQDFDTDELSEKDIEYNEN